jgi:hypothetical protein
VSVALQINTYDRGATAQVRELERELSPAKLQATYGPRCKELTRDHLAALPDNKRGWPSTGFWEAAARATRWEPHGNFIKIIVDKIGVRQRYYGGHIAPVKAGALTIPISPLSYGKTAKDFPGSFVLRTKKGAYIVMYGNQGPRPVGQSPKTKGKRGRGPQRATLIFLFKLSLGVDQAPNPNVLPTPAEYRATIFEAARERLAAIKARKGGVTK